MTRAALRFTPPTTDAVRADAPATVTVDLTSPERRFLLLACGVVEPHASTTRPGASSLTGEGVLALRRKLQGLAS